MRPRQTPLVFKFFHVVGEQNTKSFIEIVVLYFKKCGPSIGTQRSRFPVGEVSR